MSNDPRASLWLCLRDLVLSSCPKRCIGLGWGKGVPGLGIPSHQKKSSLHACHSRPYRPSPGPCPASAFSRLPSPSGSSVGAPCAFFNFFFLGSKQSLFLFTCLTLTCHSGLSSDGPSSEKLSLTSQDGPHTSPGLPQIPKHPSSELRSLSLSFPLEAPTTLGVAI